MEFFGAAQKIPKGADADVIRGKFPRADRQRHGHRNGYILVLQNDLHFFLGSFRPNLREVAQGPPNKLVLDHPGLVSQFPRKMDFKCIFGFGNHCLKILKIFLKRIGGLMQIILVQSC